MLHNQNSSGGDRGYARYASAYPAIPANACIYTYFKKNTNVLLLHG
jgi:hypothetical protein